MEIQTLQVAIDSTKATQGAAAAATAFQSLASKLESMEAVITRVTSGLAGLGGSMDTLKSSLRAAGFEPFVRGATDSSVQLERMTNKLGFASSSTAEFYKNFDFLRGVTQLLGLDLKTTGDAFDNFAIAAKDKLKPDQIRDVLLALSEASVAMGQTSGEAAAALQTMGELLSKGTLKAGELRTALEAKLPGAFTQVAKGMGQSEQEFTKFLESAGTVAGDVLIRFAKALHKTMGPPAVELVKNLNTAMTGVKDTATELAAVTEKGAAAVKSPIEQKPEGNDALVQQLTPIAPPKETSAQDAIASSSAASAKQETAGDAASKKNSSTALINARPAGVSANELLKRDVPTPEYSGDESKSDKKEKADAAPKSFLSSYFSSFQQGLGKNVVQFKDMAKQIGAVGEETSKSLTTNFSNFFSTLLTKGGKTLERLNVMFTNLRREIEGTLVKKLIAEPLAGGLASLFGKGLGALLGVPSSPATAVATAATAVPTPKSHTGSVVGAYGGTTTFVSPQLFAGAPRFHSGLAPDEFPAILQRGEAVIPKSQTGRWGGGGGDVNINVTVDGGKGGTPQQNQAFGAEIARQIESIIDLRIARAAMPRGILRPA